MADYYTTTDLNVRRRTIANWIGTEAQKMAKNMQLSGKDDTCRLANLSLMVAYLEVMECYEVVDADTDGILNCITEAQMDAVFSNVNKLTNLSFQPKDTTYTGPAADPTNQTLTLNNGLTLTLYDGEDAAMNLKEKEQPKIYD